MLTIKNVILYDPWQHVSGFVELRQSEHSTTVKVRHSLDDNLVMSLTAGGEKHMFTLDGKNRVFEIARPLDVSGEILICLVRRDVDAITTAASGILNPKLNAAAVATTPLGAILDETEFFPIHREETSEYQTRAAHEIDELLRKVCTIDDKGRGICETCPYRDHFFGDAPALY